MNKPPLVTVKTNRLVLHQTIIYILLIIAVGWALVPIIWMVLSSLKTMEDILSGINDASRKFKQAIIDKFQSQGEW